MFQSPPGLAIGRVDRPGVVVRMHDIAFPTGFRRPRAVDSTLAGLAK